MWSTLQKAAIPLSIITVVAFGCIAFFLARRRVREGKVDDTEFFLTARKSVSTWRIGWSFFASACGSWVVFSLPSYTADPTYGAGYIGLLCYALFTGLPLILIAFVGQRIRDIYPHTLSWGDFAERRFGRATQIYVSLIVLLNMGINLTAEYTAIGSLWSSVLNNPTLFGNAESIKLIPILTVGIVTMLYTAAGGLFVSIITDQFQGIFSILLLLVTMIYVAATFRLPDPLPPLPPTLDANYAGWSSIVTMGVSLIAASFFSDALWQRVWASENAKTLRVGACMGAGISIVVAFLFGFGGFLAAWAGYMGADSNNAFFDLITKGNTTNDVWVVVLVVLITTAMNESAVDSFQNALTDTVVALAMSLRIPKLFGQSHFPINAARLTVIIINVPIVVVALQGYKINQLYLITNMVTSTTLLPLLLGLVKPLEGYVHGRSVLFGCIFSLFSVATYGTVKTGSFTEGVKTYFYLIYDWPPFIIALVASLVGVAIAAGAEALLRLSMGWHVKVVKPPRPAPEEIKVSQSAVTVVGSG